MCVLFRGELKGTTSCPKCKRSRIVEGSNIVPYKVFCHFPLIPRLKWMYKCPTLVDLMTWHNVNKSTDGLVCLICVSKTWKHIHMTQPDFARNPCNIRLGLAFDGVNPYVDLSTNHFTWLVLLLNYNMPPWLTTKKFFVMLILLILANDFVKNENINVYLQPLVEELEKLWKGVKACDVTRP